jgi:hypothetical protein
MIRGGDRYATQRLAIAHNDVTWRRYERLS